MTREELREKVANRLRHTYGEDQWLAFADAAIALVLEEAAKVAETLLENYDTMDTIPAAIRALKDTTGIEKSGGTS